MTIRSRLRIENASHRVDSFIWHNTKKNNVCYKAFFFLIRMGFVNIPMLQVWTVQSWWLRFPSLLYKTDVPIHIGVFISNLECKQLSLFSLCGLSVKYTDRKPFQSEKGKNLLFLKQDVKLKWDLKKFALRETFNEALVDIYFVFFHKEINIWLFSKPLNKLVYLLI